MTNNSYDMPPHVYVRTSAYSAVNPADSGRHREFVTDLYQAFLQREPDTPGLDWWRNEVFLHGRKQVIRAFEGSIEFESIVNQLFDSGGSCCFVSLRDIPRFRADPPTFRLIPFTVIRTTATCGLA